MALYDFAAYLDDPSLSDIDVLIVLKTEHQPDTSGATSSSGRKRPHDEDDQQPAATLPGHRLLLHRASPVFAAQLERWQEDAATQEGAGQRGRRRTSAKRPIASCQPGKPTVTLSVDTEDDAEAAQMLYRCIYRGAEALAGASQAQLLAVMRLADKYEVQRSVEVVGQLLAAIPRDQLEWETVHITYTLPEACMQAPAFAAALAAAKGKVCHEFGDLDVAMRSGMKQQQLLSLPLAALVALLKDDHTRASCEDTALAVATAWWCERWPKAGQPKVAPHSDLNREQHAVQLAAAVRFGRLSPVVLMAVAARTEWVRLAVRDTELWELAIFAAGGKGCEAARMSIKKGVVEEHSEWLAPERPLSVVTEASWVIEVAVEQLKSATEQLLGSSRSSAAGAGVNIWPCEAQFFRGFSWKPFVQATCSNDGKGVIFSVHTVIMDEQQFDRKADQCIPCCMKATAVQTAAAAANRRRLGKVEAEFPSEAIPVLIGRGWINFFDLGVQRSWSREAWEAKGLILEGDKVRVEVKVTKPRS